jgi:hypothetical protein
MLSQTKIVATLAPASGIYNVVATATERSRGVALGCKAEAVSSHGAATSATPLGDGAGSRTATATGAMLISRGSVIEVSCRGTSLSGGTFFSGTVHDVNVTALLVNTAQGTINHGTMRPTHHKTGGHPVNTFNRTLKPRPHRSGGSK